MVKKGGGLFDFLKSPEQIDKEQATAPAPEQAAAPAPEQAPTEVGPDGKPVPPREKFLGLFGGKRRKSKKSSKKAKKSSKRKTSHKKK
jgi:hypothetical protein